MITNPKTKKILRIVFYSVAVAGVIVVLMISTGLAAFIFNGYDEYFDRSKYQRGQLIFKTEYLLEESENITFSGTTPYDPDKTVTCNAEISVNADSGEVTVTIKNKNSFSDSYVFTCVTPEKSGSVYNGGEISGKVATQVFLCNGDEETECELIKYDFEKKQSTYTFKAPTVKSFDKIKIVGFMITEFKKR